MFMKSCIFVGKNSMERETYFKYSQNFPSNKQTNKQNLDFGAQKLKFAHSLNCYLGL